MLITYTSLDANPKKKKIKNKKINLCINQECNLKELRKINPEIYKSKHKYIY